MPWIIPSFRKGLVDKASRSKLTDDYKTRCSELTNMYITKEDSIRIRPPAVLEDVQIPTGSNIIDYTILADNTVVHIREMGAEDIANMQLKQRTLLLALSVDTPRADFITYLGQTVQDLDNTLRDAFLVADTYEDSNSSFASRTEALNYLMTPAEGEKVGRGFKRKLQVNGAECLGNIEYKAYVLQIGNVEHYLFINRFVSNEGSCIENAASSTTPFGDKVLPSLFNNEIINYNYEGNASLISINENYGLDSLSKVSHSSLPLIRLLGNDAPGIPGVPLKVEWDIPITKLELYRDEVYFNFANQHLKINKNKLIVNEDSSSLITTITSDHDLESKLIPTENQMWNLRDLPIKIIEFDAPVLSYTAKLPPETAGASPNSYSTYALDTGVTQDETSISAGLDTRTLASSDDGTTNNDADIQSNLIHIWGSGPYRRNRTYETWGSKTPIGFYKGNILETDTEFPTLKLQGAEEGKGNCTILDSEDFFTKSEFHENMRSVFNHISPCVTHYDHLSIDINGSDDISTSFNLFADIKATKGNKDYLDWHHPIFNFMSGGVRYYVFATPNSNAEINTAETSAPNESIFSEGNGKTNGGLGVRFEVQSGNMLEVEDNHDTALYNKLGTYIPSGLVYYSLDDMSGARSVEKAKEINDNRGITHLVFHMYYDYTQDSVKDALKDVKYIGGIVNDGEKLNKYFLSESSDNFSMSFVGDRELSDNDILRGIYYAKYPNIEYSFIDFNDDPDVAQHNVVVLKSFAYSLMPYNMPEELIGVGKRYILNQSKNTINQKEEILNTKKRTLSGDNNGIFDTRLLEIWFRNEFRSLGSQESGLFWAPIPTIYGRGAYFYDGTIRVNRVNPNNTTELTNTTVHDNIIYEYANNSSAPDIGDNEVLVRARRVQSFYGNIRTGSEKISSQVTNGNERRYIRYDSVTDRSVLLNPTFLTTRKETPKQLLGGAIVFDSNNLNTSRVAGLGRQENREIFANTIANYFAARPNAKEDSYILASGISLDRAELVAGANVYSFLTPRGQPDSVVDVVDDDNRIIVGLENSIRALSSFGAAQEQIISNAGTSTDLATESRYILGALGDDIFQLAYYQEAGGYVHNVVNTDLNPGDRFNMVAGLFGRHKLYFFGQEGAQEIYALAMGTGRSPKGISKLTFDFPIHEIFHFTQDKLALRSDSRIYTLDFSKEAFREDGTPEVYMDDPAGSRTQPAPFMCAVESLPVLEVDGVRPTPFDRMNIIRAAVGTEGFVDFEFSIINAQGRKTVKKGVSNRKRELEYTSGLTLIEGLHASGTAYPSIRIEKQTSKYLAISSVILETKNSRGQE